MSKSTFPSEPDVKNMPGYDYGKPNSAHSSLSLAELREIEETVGWTSEDADTLQRHGDIFRQRGEQMVDAWRAVIGSKPYLAKWFVGPNGKPDDEYKSQVKKRFVQWVADAALRPHDQAWLDYQEEIGLRHMPEKKNRTDDAHTPPVVPLRYVLAFITTITTTSRKFFAAAGVDGVELQKLEDAWAKAVLLHVTLWSRPYAKDGLW